MINYTTIFFNKHQFFQRSRSLEKGLKMPTNDVNMTLLMMLSKSIVESIITKNRFEVKK